MYIYVYMYIWYNTHLYHGKYVYPNIHCTLLCVTRFGVGRPCRRWAENHLPYAHLSLVMRWRCAFAFPRAMAVLETNSMIPWWFESGMAEYDIGIREELSG